MILITGANGLQEFICFRLQELEITYWALIRNINKNFILTQLDCLNLRI